MQFEVDSKILDLLRAKAEKQGIELQQLLENFARAEPSNDSQLLVAVLQNFDNTEDIDASCKRIDDCTTRECNECPFNSRGQLVRTIKETES